MNALGAARRRKKLAKLHHTFRATPGSYQEDQWEFGKGTATTARYDKKWYEREQSGQLHGVGGEQAPVKYNRCKHCGYRRHCSPDLLDMWIRKDAEAKAERKSRESES